MVVFIFMLKETKGLSKEDLRTLYVPSALQITATFGEDNLVGPMDDSVMTASRIAV